MGILSISPVVFRVMESMSSLSIDMGSGMVGLVGLWYRFYGVYGWGYSRGWGGFTDGVILVSSISR